MLTSRYKILEEENLIIEIHNGQVVKNSLTSFKKKLTEDPAFKKNMKFLVHIKNVEFHTSQDDMHKFAKFMSDKNNPFGKRKIAILTETPEQVVSSTLYQALMPKKENKVEIFTTNIEAFKFLNLDLSKFDFFNSEIQKLKTKS